VGVAAAGAAVGLGLAALSARDDYEATRFTDRELYDDASTLRLFTNVAWAAAATSGIAGAILVLTSKRAPAGAARSGVGSVVLRF
jgi:hypothetical protein